VGHLHDRHASALPVDQIGLGGLEDVQGQDGGASGKVKHAVKGLASSARGSDNQGLER
jgi:hypothetical protein